MWQSAAGPLIEVFHEKCAYCESLMSKRTYLDVDHHRPKSIYWWLAHEWENLYPFCPQCASYKGSSFPVLGKPAKPELRGPDLQGERALLLDP
jgi:5-methylcytosine-specific restriction endonuclease McrA